MADAVQDRIEREARFASDVSHELRSPITALSAAVEVLDGRREELPERSQQALDVVVNQVRRFDQMVLDLLELSRLEAGVDESHREPVVLSDTVRRDRGPQRLRRRALRRHRRSEVPIILDRRRVERIVVNLLDNAKAHAGGPARVALEDGSRGTLRLVVEDSGPGVPPGERDRVFERFYRGTEARRRVGTGLGPGPGQRARHGHGWSGLGRGSPRRRGPLRGVVPGGPGVTLASAGRDLARDGRSGGWRPRCWRPTVALGAWACGVAPEGRRGRSTGATSSSGWPTPRPTHHVRPRCPAPTAGDDAATGDHGPRRAGQGLPGPGRQPGRRRPSDRRSGRICSGIIRELQNGPTSAERAAGLRTAVPFSAVTVLGISQRGRHGHDRRGAELPRAPPVADRAAAGGRSAGHDPHGSGPRHRPRPLHGGGNAVPVPRCDGSAPQEARPLGVARRLPAAGARAASPDPPCRLRRQRRFGGLSAGQGEDGEVVEGEELGGVARVARDAIGADLQERACAGPSARTRRPRAGSAAPCRSTQPIGSRVMASPAPLISSTKSDIDRLLRPPTVPPGGPATSTDGGGFTAPVVDVGTDEHSGRRQCASGDTYVTVS